MTGYGLEDQGVEVWVPVGSIIFTSPYCRDRPCGPPIQWVLWALFVGGHDSHCSPPTNAEVMEMWIDASSPPYIYSWRSAWLIKQRDNFTIYLYMPSLPNCFSSEFTIKIWMFNFIVWPCQGWKLKWYTSNRIIIIHICNGKFTKSIAIRDFSWQWMNVNTKLWRTINKKQNCNIGAGTTNIKLLITQTSNRGFIAQVNWQQVPFCLRGEFFP